MTRALKCYNGGRALVFVISWFAEASAEVGRICNIITHELAKTSVSYNSDSAKQTKGIF